MSRLRFCANLTMMFGESSNLIDRYQLAKAAGFKAVECAFPYDFPKEDLLKAKNDAGVDQVLLNAFPGTSLGFAALEGKEKDFMDSLVKSVEYCKTLGCKRLHIMSGKPSGDNKGSRDVLLKNLRSAIPLLEQNGIVGLIEPINHYSVPGYFLNDFELGAGVVKELDSASIRLQLDLFHLQFLKGDLTNNIKKYLPITGHVQIAQVPDRHEPCSPGEINYSYVFDVLDKAGYEGWIGLEYIPSGKTEDSLQWMK